MAGVARTGTTVTVSLLTRDGGTEADRLTSDDPQLNVFVDERNASREKSAPEG